MSTPATFKIEGLGELNRKLRALPDAARGRSLRTAVKAGADVIGKQARANAARVSPSRAKHVKTRESAGFTATNVEYVVGVPGGRHDGFVLNFFELGAPDRVRESGASTGSLAADPWLRPAFDARKREAQMVAVARLKAQIEAAAR